MVQIAVSSRWFPLLQTSHCLCRTQRAISPHLLDDSGGGHATNRTPTRCLAGTRRNWRISSHPTSPPSLSPHSVQQSLERLATSHSVHCTNGWKWLSDLCNRLGNRYICPVALFSLCLSTRVSSRPDCSRHDSDRRHRILAANSASPPPLMLESLSPFRLALLTPNLPRDLAATMHASTLVSSVPQKVLGAFSRCPVSTGVGRPLVRCRLPGCALSRK